MATANAGEYRESRSPPCVSTLEEENPNKETLPVVNRPGNTIDGTGIDPRGPVQRKTTVNIGDSVAACTNDNSCVNNEANVVNYSNCYVLERGNPVVSSSNSSHGDRDTNIWYPNKPTVSPNSNNSNKKLDSTENQERCSDFTQNQDCSFSTGRCLTVGKTDNLDDNIINSSSSTSSSTETDTNVLNFHTSKHLTKDSRSTNIDTDTSTLSVLDNAELKHVLNICKPLNDTDRTLETTLEILDNTENNTARYEGCQSAAAQPDFPVHTVENNSEKNSASNEAGFPNPHSIVNKPDLDVTTGHQQCVSATSQTSSNRITINPSTGHSGQLVEVATAEGQLKLASKPNRMENKNQPRTQENRIKDAKTYNNVITERNDEENQIPDVFEQQTTEANCSLNENIRNTLLNVKNHREIATTNEANFSSNEITCKTLSVESPDETAMCQSLPVNNRHENACAKLIIAADKPVTVQNENICALLTDKPRNVNNTMLSQSCDTDKRLNTTDNSDNTLSPDDRTVKDKHDNMKKPCRSGPDDDAICDTSSKHGDNREPMCISNSSSSGGILISSSQKSNDAHNCEAISISRGKPKSNITSIHVDNTDDPLIAHGTGTPTPSCTNSIGMGANSIDKSNKSFSSHTNDDSIGTSISANTVDISMDNTGRNQTSHESSIRTNRPTNTCCTSPSSTTITTTQTNSNNRSEQSNVSLVINQDENTTPYDQSEKLLNKRPIKIVAKDVNVVVKDEKDVVVGNGKAGGFTKHGHAFLRPFKSKKETTPLRMCKSLIFDKLESEDLLQPQGGRELGSSYSNIRKKLAANKRKRCVSSSCENDNKRYISLKNDYDDEFEEEGDTPMGGCKKSTSLSTITLTKLKNNNQKIYRKIDHILSKSWKSLLNVQTATRSQHDLDDPSRSKGEGGFYKNPFGTRSVLNVSKNVIYKQPAYSKSWNEISACLHEPKRRYMSQLSETHCKKAAPAELEPPALRSVASDEHVVRSFPYPAELKLRSFSGGSGSSSSVDLNSPTNLEPLKPINRLRVPSICEVNESVLAGAGAASSKMCSRCSSLLSMASCSKYSVSSLQGFVPVATCSDTAGGQSPVTSGVVLCKVCLLEVPNHESWTLSDCNCCYCLECVLQYVEFEIGQGAYQISCPDAACEKQGLITLTEIQTLVTGETFEKHKRFRLNKEVDLDKSRAWCPSPGCDTICSLRTGDRTLPQRVTCPTCSHEFCSLCRSPPHPGAPCNRAPIGGATFDSELIKCCPMCSVPIEKDEGCAQMLCKRCKHVFCWYCLASLDDDFLLRHYDKGPCKNKLGHSRASVIWHRTQVIGIFAGFGILLLVASPLLLLAAPCIVCCKCHVCTSGDGDDDLPIDTIVDLPDPTLATSAGATASSSGQQEGTSSGGAMTSNIPDLPGQEETASSGKGGSRKNSGTEGAKCLGSRKNSCTDDTKTLGTDCSRKNSGTEVGKSLCAEESSRIKSGTQESKRAANSASGSVEHRESSTGQQISGSSSQEGTKTFGLESSRKNSAFRTQSLKTSSDKESSSNNSKLEGSRSLDTEGSKSLAGIECSKSLGSG
uniref:E3 ubiquitin-protein ligase RNF144B n=1 Tax=Cacopsylla melanoneura TaxID=428564 RepID=A0A8D8WI01_9HEMI